MKSTTWICRHENCVDMLCCYSKLLNKQTRAATGSFAPADPKVPTCNVSRMHIESRDMCDWFPLGGHRQNCVFGVNENYRRGQLKLLYSGFAWIRPAVVEIKNIAGKLLLSHWTWLKARKHRTFATVSGNRDYSETYGAYSNGSVYLLTSGTQWESQSFES